MKEKYEIKIESEIYDTKKTYKRVILMDDANFVAFISDFLTFLEGEGIEDFRELEK